MPIIIRGGCRVAPGTNSKRQKWTPLTIESIGTSPEINPNHWTPLGVRGCPSYARLIFLISCIVGFRNHRM